MCVEGEVLGRTFQIIVDTGSSITMINKNAWEEIRQPDMVLKGPCLRLTMVDGSETTSYGKHEVTLTIRGMKFQIQLEITDCEDDLVLGLDFMRQHVRALDLDRLKMKIRRQEVPITLYQPPEFSVRILAAEEVIIPAATEKLIYGAGKGGNDREGILEMEPNPSLERPWLTARSLVKFRDGRIPVRIINTKPEDVKIKKGAYLGTFTNVEGTIDGERKKRKRVRRLTKADSSQQNWKNFEKLREVAETTGRLNTTQRQRLVDLLHDNKASFSNDAGELGQTNLVQHEIHTKDHRPIKQPPRRLPPQHREKVDELVEDMLKKGVIERSTSPWASPIVLVKKKDGSLRFCVDYRRLNAVTEKDAYPLPRIDDTISAFNGAQWFSTLDLTSGYWQVGMSDDAKKKAAFCIPGGLYQFRVMSFGLCNAPGTFERLMERVLAGLSWKSCLLYLDDIIVYSQTFDQHLKHLKEVLDRIRQAGMKLKPEKCQLFRSEVNFLGHIIARDGIRTDPAKTGAVRQWATPKNVTDVRSFLGLCSYYRKFVPNFSDIAAPLHELTKKKSIFAWGREQQNAFVTLKDRLVSAPVLSYPRDHGRFVLDTDASNTGIGAVLSQQQGSDEHVLMYLSRSLTREERQYCVTRKELLAVVYAVRQCRQYLLGRKFLIRTDHGSLTWLTNFKEPQGQVARWIEILSPFDYTIQHRPGKRHQNADALSRDPCGQCGKIDWKQAKIDAWDIAAPTRQARSHGRPRKNAEAQADDEGPAQPAPPRKRRRPKKEDDAIAEPPAPARKRGRPRKAASTAADSNSNAATNQDEPRRPGNWMQQYSPEEVREKQSNEPWYAVIRDVIEDGELSRPFSELSGEEKMLYGMRRQLVIEDGILYRKWRTSLGRTRLQLVVPMEMRKEIFRLAHAAPTGGHLGARRMAGGLRRRFFWPGLLADIKQWTLSCEECASRSTHRLARAQMQKYRVGRPMERVAMDVMGPLPTTTRGNKYILVIGDYFTKWIEAYPMPNQEAKTVADKLTLEFIARYGAPIEIHSDQGRNFEAAVMKDVCRMLGIHKTRTTAFRPQSDGFIERFNRTLQQILSLYTNEQQTDWDRMIPLALTAYRATPQETTGQTPNMLMLGREVTLPVDLVVGKTPDDVDIEVTEYGHDLRDKMEQVFEIVRKKSGREMHRQKRLYDRRKADPTVQRFMPGTMVWIAIKTRTPGKAPKLQRKWKGPAVILRQYSDVTYLVAEKGGREKVVHFDIMKPYNGEQHPRWIQRLQRRLEHEVEVSSNASIASDNADDEQSSASSADE